MNKEDKKKLFQHSLNCVLLGAVILASVYTAGQILPAQQVPALVEAGLKVLLAVVIVLHIFYSLGVLFAVFSLYTKEGDTE